MSSSVADPPSHERHAFRNRPRWRVVLVLVLLIGIVVTAWLLLNKQQNSMVAGRPLSYPQTHLHTVVISGRPGVVYLGTHYGIFTSSDSGRTWPQSQGDLNTNMVTAIAVSPTNPDLLAVLTIPTSGLGRQAGIYVSSDAGKNWRFTVPANLPSSAYPYTLVSGLGARGRFYAFFTYAGWFETQDLGQHWYSITNSNLANIQTPSLLTDPANPDHLWMGGDLGLFETRNDGQNWQNIVEVRGSVTALTASMPTTGHTRTILCSTDQGLYRWQEQQNQITQISNLPAFTPPTRLVLSADGFVLYALFGSDLWFSPNQGTSWVQRWHFTRNDLVALVLNPANPAELLAGFFSPGLVLISTNTGKTWQTLTN
jgi:photosystem II stability/assembly factor-like uncharacterized protein